MHLRRSQEIRDHPQYICIALRGVIEPRCIDEHNSPPVYCEFVRELDLVCT